MQFFVYILYSASLDKYYVGHTHDLQDRLMRHNNKGSLSTKAGPPWVLKYTEGFLSKAEAANRELEIKRKKSRKYLEFLISSAG